MHTFLQVTALVVSVAASLFLIRGVIGMPVKNMAELSRTKWTYNTDVTRDLAGRRADTVVGAALILMSFILQSINFLRPMRWRDFGVDSVGLIIGITVSIVICFVAYRVCVYLQKRWYTQAKGILEAGINGKSNEKEEEQE